MEAETLLKILINKSQNEDCYQRHNHWIIIWMYSKKEIVDGRNFVGLINSTESN